MPMLWMRRTSIPMLWRAQASTSSATRRSSIRVRHTARNRGNVPAAGSAYGATTIPPAAVIPSITAWLRPETASEGELPVPCQ